MPPVWAVIMDWAAIAAAAISGATGLSIIAVYEGIMTVVTVVALNAVMRALAPHGPKPEMSPRTQAIADTMAHAKILYGTVCVAGVHVIPPITTTGTGMNGTTYAGQWTHRIQALAQHEVDSFGPIRINQRYVDQSALHAVTGSVDDGRVDSSGYEFDHDGDTRWLMIRTFKGTSSDALDWIMGQADPSAFTSRFRTRGVATAMATFNFGKVFEAGVPPMSYVVHGMKCYDPRKDSTNGGSGSHRYATPSTWEWTQNPILCAANYIIVDRSLGGGGYDPAQDIDWPLIAAAANVCDAMVDGPPVVANLVTTGSAGTVTITGNTIVKTAGSAAWDSQARSTVGMTTGRITASDAGGAGSWAIGLDSNPSADANYTSIDYCWQRDAAGGAWKIYENGSLKLTLGAPASTDIVELLYDGTHIAYILNGKWVRVKKTPSVAATLYFDSSLNSVGATAGMRVNCQPRYTCNIELDGSALFEDNLGYLIDAAFGRAIDRDGQWRLYAGAWNSPTFTINQNDWIGPMKVQAVAPRREGRWNAVRSFYYDPMRNWGREECAPRTNAGYKTADGDERIWQELDRPAINSEGNAQYVAELTLRQSRNGIKVSGTLPPRFQRLAIWETGTIVHADFGWSTKTFRLVNYSLNPDGSVAVGLCEEQSTDWLDMASAEYNQPDKFPIPQSNDMGPSPPLSLAVLGVINGTITFNIGEPAIKLPNFRYQIIAGMNSGNAAVGTVIWDGVNQFATVPAPTSMQWYWSRVRVESLYSEYMPNTFGIGVSADQFDTGQIAPGAATDVFVTTCNSTTLSGAGFHVVMNQNVGPYGFDTNVRLSGVLSAYVNAGGGTIPYNAFGQYQVQCSSWNTPVNPIDLADQHIAVTSLGMDTAQPYPFNRTFALSSGHVGSYQIVGQLYTALRYNGWVKAGVLNTEVVKL